MELLEAKALLGTLVLPPAGPLLLAFAGLLATLRWRRTGVAVAALASTSLWFLSCNAVASSLATSLLALPPPISDADLKRVQAIVVLGGGVLPQAPEYGAAQPNGNTLARLRYGAWLARRTKLPLGFSGGVGWTAMHTGAASEGEVARRVAREDFGIPLRWVDDVSRDTKENAERMAPLLKKDGITRIALVTDAWHLQRGAGHFRAQGLEVVAAPTGFPGWLERSLMEWLPSAHGLSMSRQVIREWLALQVLPPAAPGNHP